MVCWYYKDPLMLCREVIDVVFDDNLAGHVDTQWWQHVAFLWPFAIKWFIRCIAGCWFSSWKMQRIRWWIVTILVQPWLGFFPFHFFCGGDKSFYKKVKWCNLNIGFCTLHREFISSSREFSVAVHTAATGLWSVNLFLWVVANSEVRTVVADGR